MLDPGSMGSRPIAHAIPGICQAVALEQTAQDVWWVAAVALVTGHALSVFVAHAQAMRLFSCRKTATFSQLPMMVFMVFLTSFSLWVLAQPVVN